MIRVVDAAALTLWAAALFGLVVRDRVPDLAALTYAPACLIGLAAAAYDVLRLGRTLPVRGLFVAGGLLLAWAGAREMSGGQAFPTLASPAEPTEALRIVQQNVWWGGGRGRHPSDWARMQDELLSRTPDVLILSEAPERSWNQDLLSRFGAATQKKWWLTVTRAHPHERHYWFRLALLTPFPHRSTAVTRLDQGVVLEVVAESPQGPLRVWVVDGVSAVTRDRRRMLGDLHRRLVEAERQGRPVDILAGDFNAPAKSAGFDRLRETHWLASEHSPGWRATWPASVPLVDVDHIWLRRKTWTGTHGGQFRLHASDHRGTWVDARRAVPGPPIWAERGKESDLVRRP